MLYDSFEIHLNTNCHGLEKTMYKIYYKSRSQDVLYRHVVPS